MGDALTSSLSHQRAANFEQISAAVTAGTIDTVIVALTDMQGRLQGKRLHAPYFVDEVVKHGTEACAYLLAVDIDMNTVDGYELTSWESGYGDFVLVPDPATTKMLPWQEGTALVLADVQKLDGTPVAASPRQLLRLNWPGRPSVAGPRTPAPSWSSSCSRTPTSRPGTRATAG